MRIISEPAAVSLPLVLSPVLIDAPSFSLYQGNVREPALQLPLLAINGAHILPSAALPDSRPFSSMLSSCQLSLFLEEHFPA